MREITPEAGRRARAVAGRVRQDPGDPRPRAEPRRARHLLGDVERALLLQVVEALAPAAADRGAAGDLRAGRERRRGRHRRGHGCGLQDREPQPPELHRALPGRRDRRRRHPARRLHDGRAARWRCSIRCASARPTTPGPAICWPAWSPASAATATASACRRSAARPPSTAPTTATSWSTRCASASLAQDQIFYARAAGIGNPVVYVGAKTGRDGIHGATMASAEFSEARPRPSGRPCRSATRSPRSCCSRPASS